MGPHSVDLKKMGVKVYVKSAGEVLNLILRDLKLPTMCPFYWYDLTSIPAMMTSSNGNIFRVTGHLCGEFIGPRWIPTQRPVTQSFDVFFDLHSNKRLSKQWPGWWFDTQSCPLWRHRNAAKKSNYLSIPKLQWCNCWILAWMSNLVPHFLCEQLLIHAGINLIRGPRSLCYIQSLMFALEMIMVVKFSRLSGS